MADSMSLNPDSAVDSSTSVLHRCREFESALRDGSRPTIEGYLTDTAGEDREQLVVALVRVEIRFRQQCGEAPKLPEYLARFPDYADALNETVPPLLTEQGDRLMSTLIAQPGNPVTLDVSEQFSVGIPRQLGRYQLQEVLGRGGFGEVWQALDPILHRTVAVKTLRRDRELSAAALESFLNEGRHLAQLKHPGIVSVYDVGVEQGRAYIVSEFIDGTTLQKLIDQQTFTWQEASLLVAAIADALQKAHEANIFHRDIKPSNILMDRRGVPHVADFGLAVTEEQQMFESVSTLGTFGYMPPEQVNGQSQLADGRADIYSLGVILYRLLTERLPFIAKDIEQYRVQVLQRAPRPLRSIIPTLPEELEQACLKCLAKAPENRFYTASDLAGELRCIVALHQPAAVPVSRPAQNDFSRQRWVAVALVALAIAAAIPWLRTMFSPSVVPDSNQPHRLIGGDSVNEDPGLLVVSEVEVTAPELKDVSWDVLDENSIRVSSPATGLVQLGEYDESDGRLSFEVEIEPSNVVIAGLFFGHKPHGDNDENIRYVAVDIQLWRQESQMLVVHQPDFPILNQALGGDPWAGNVPAPMDSRAVSQKLGVTIEGGRIVEVRLDGEPAAGVLDGWDARFPADSNCFGAFGLICGSGFATFRDPVLNEVQARFSVGSSHLEADENAEPQP